VRDQEDSALFYTLNGGTLAPCGDSLKRAVASSVKLQRLFGSDFDTDVEMAPAVVEDSPAADRDAKDGKDAKEDAALAASSIALVRQRH
jgi:hypothetical protein